MWQLVKLRALVFLVIGLFVLGLIGGRAAAEDQLLFDQGRLFEVSQAGQPPSYVFGTMHINDRKVLKLPTPIANALRQSETILLEFDDVQGDPAATLRAWTYTDGRTLPDVIGPALYQQVAQLADELRLRQDVVARTKPGILWFMLGTMKMRQESGAAGRPVLDHALMEFAQKKGIPVVGLDHDAEIDALFVSRFTEAEQIALLRNAVEGFNDGKLSPRYLRERRDLYLAGNLGALLREASFNVPDAALEAKLEREFLTARNQRWIPRMEGYLKRGRAFVAVGAAHLPGETGILHLLQKEGFQVRRVL